MSTPACATAMPPLPKGANARGAPTIVRVLSACRKRLIALPVSSKTVFSVGSGSTLPLATSLSTRLTGQQPFVPIGPGWGLIQSAGPNGTFGNADDQLILAHY